MTDLEKIKLCAEVMGEVVIQALVDGSGCLNVQTQHYQYDPLHDDAQVMALVRKFKLSVNPQADGSCEVSYFDADDEIRVDAKEGINCAIVECIAKMQLATHVVSHSETGIANNG